MNTLRSGIILMALALFMVGCKNATLVNIHDRPLTVGSNVSLADITKGITKTGDGLGWKMYVVKPGLIRGTLIQSGGKHVIIVNIKYDTTNYSIVYSGSTNMKYNPENFSYDGNETIHPAYNEWTERLNVGIQTMVF